MSKKTDIWMPLYIGEYLADTMHLTTEQSGAYLFLIMAYWRKKSALQSSPASLASICRMSLDAWSIHQAVLEEFFDTSTDGVWIHKRIEKELELAGIKKVKAEEKARKAAESRWNKPENAPSNAPSNAQAMLDTCPSPSPSEYKTTTTNNSTGENLHFLAQSFPMHEDWFPSENFQEYLLSSGVSEPWVLFHDEFVLYWTGQPQRKETQSGWDSKFLKSIKRAIANREANLA